jgi:hypothetical protein
MAGCKNSGHLLNFVVLIVTNPVEKDFPMKISLRMFCGMLLVTSMGCGSNAKVPKWPEPIKVTGIVTLDDEPLNGATISFNPVDSTLGTGAIGTTDDSGQYEPLSRMPDGKSKYGIIPGKYRVSLSRMVKPDGTPWRPDPSRPGGPMNSGARDVMPPEFSLASKLMIDVAEGKDEYDFNLKTKKK